MGGTVSWCPTPVLFLLSIFSAVFLKISSIGYWIFWVESLLHFLTLSYFLEDNYISHTSIDCFISAIKCLIKWLFILVPFMAFCLDLRKQNFIILEILKGAAPLCLGVYVTCLTKGFLAPTCELSLFISWSVLRSLCTLCYWLLKMWDQGSKMRTGILFSHRLDCNPPFSKRVNQSHCLYVSFLLAQASSEDLL